MMPFNRGRFPANNPMLPARGTPSPEPEAFEETTQNSPSGDEPMSSRKLRDRSDSISPPPDYVPPPRDHSPPPPTLQIPEPTLPPPGYKIPKSPPQDPSLPPSTCKLPAPRKYFKHRQELVDEYLAALAQKRNDSNIDYKLLSEAAAIMTKQLKAQHEWLNPNAQLRLSLPGWFVPGVAEAQDHLLHRMKYTGWAQRGPEAIAQQWVHGVYKDGPGQAARDLAIRKRGLISPF
ncbi:hypothetical protein CLAFUW4_09053 [Fulvia fulva]|uniref:uncharacterized protein n=1 Tax=Passalora fulva TaxID=5499 RepID=UPI002852B372|nr:uncharacterized protein CLAFUR5_20272 [Fulvia fulva]KAK4613932.1 hypothetical protein CLAFUR4_09059 [Fulvia fulva]KAK4614430.1 hypothetical protein CLAFUR0_09051 [Fulvia fulva]WMI39003.1 hypothetical protein CLAFUR5_20272 [Fulvia fulva]WPV20586.1 hypothetical protein CLAFUW4_09053 [Fulvia fulva]WPV34890.1 hypothetical protein CLAFUW7_09054 [Fulvia fulva]